MATPPRCGTAWVCNLRPFGLSATRDSMANLRTWGTRANVVAAAMRAGRIAAQSGIGKGNPTRSSVGRSQASRSAGRALAMYAPGNSPASLIFAPGLVHLHRHRERDAARCLSHPLGGRVHRPGRATPRGDSRPRRRQPPSPRFTGAPGGRPRTRARLRPLAPPPRRPSTPELARGRAVRPALPSPRPRSPPDPARRGDSFHAATVTGRSVLLRSVRHGTPRTVVSSWIPPSRSAPGARRPPAR